MVNFSKVKSSRLAGYNYLSGSLFKVLIMFITEAIDERHEGIALGTADKTSTARGQDGFFLHSPIKLEKEFVKEDIAINIRQKAINWMCS